MTVAMTLFEAADYAASNLLPPFIAGTLQAKTIAFWTAASAIFPEQTPGNQPMGNWCAVIAAWAPNILPGATGTAGPTQFGNYETYLRTVDYVYRFCKLGQSLYDGIAVPQITLAQYNALLAAYNAQYA